jgi:protoporphyrinogen oxidase
VDSLSRSAEEERRRVVIVGAGPAGLTASYALMQAKVPSVVLEQALQVGGLARTVEHRGFLFDIGGHRFFTRSEEVKRIWREVLPDGFLRVRRLSRIYYRGRFFQYPLALGDALGQMGVVESAWVLASYMRKRLFPIRDETNLDAWMSNRFGRRLYLMFFRAYTEKVWGLPPSRIRSEWAKQRIRTLTLWGAIRSALLPRLRRPRSLTAEFDYPERGPGMLWQRMTEILEAAGHPVLLGRNVTRVLRTGSRVEAVVAGRGASEELHPGTDFVATMPLADLVLALDPPLDAETLAHARALRHRAFVNVALVLRRGDLFPDNWIYVHTPDIGVARIQNYRNWSPAMVPQPDRTCLGMEYFCSEGDAQWARSDACWVEAGKADLERLGLARADEVEDGVVVRQPKAYPVYDSAYHAHVDHLRRALVGFDNLQMAGRNGLHRYDNQDQAMLTALSAARRVLGEGCDAWAVQGGEEDADPPRAVAAD